MKIRSYRTLFRLFSFLSDKTNGAPLFVKYKLIFGSLIIGMTSNTSCIKTSKPTCYSQTYVTTVSDNDSVEMQIMCYEVAAPVYDSIVPIDSIDNNDNNDNNKNTPPLSSIESCAMTV